MCHHLNVKKELQSFPGIISYMPYFSAITAGVCELLQKLTSVKTEWLWNGMYQDLYNKTKNIINQDVCMKLNDTSKPLYWRQMPLVFT